MEAKLSDGFTVTIDEKHLNDWKLLKLLRGIDKGETSLIVDVAETLLGEDQVEELEKHLAVDGVTPIDSMVNAIREIMESQTSLKNS